MYTATKTTRSSAIAKRPRDASCQLKSCQLPCNSAETTCMTSPEQIEVMKIAVQLEAMCNKHVHSTRTRPSHFHCLIGVINKPTTVEFCISPVYLLWRNFLSPQCRNCSRDRDHAHLGNTYSSQDKDFAWPTHVQNLNSLATAEILHEVQNSKTGQLTPTTPLSGKIFHRQGGTCYVKSMYKI